MSFEEITYSLKELSAAAEVSPRTIRYYVKQGVLPPAARTGPAPSVTMQKSEMTAVETERRLIMIHQTRVRLSCDGSPLITRFTRSPT